MKGLLPAIFSILVGLPVLSQTPELPAELKVFVKQGFTVLDYAKGNLDDDAIPDYVMVLAQEGEDTITFRDSTWMIHRIAVLLKGNADGSFLKAAENKEAVLCRNCGGVMGDPFQEIIIKDRTFTFSHYGGSSWRWTSDYRFAYDKSKKDWYLDEDVSSSFHAASPETTETTVVIKRAEVGDIRFSDFTLNYNADSLLWEVTASKTYFYKSPDIQSRPGKGYLVKGDSFHGVKQFRNFIQGYFENSKGVITSGFLLRKDLTASGNLKAVQ